LVHPAPPICTAIRQHRARPGGGNSARRGERAAALLLVPALHPGLPQQLAVLLLGHPLAALLDNRTHGTTLAPCQWLTGMAMPRPDPGRLTPVNATAYPLVSRSPPSRLPETRR